MGGWGGRRPPSSRRGRLARRARPSGRARVKAGTAPGGRGGAHLPSPPRRACGARWAPRRSCRGCSRTRWRTRTRCQVSGAPAAPGAGRRGARGPAARRRGARTAGLRSRPAGAARPRARGRASRGARRAGGQGRGAVGAPGPQAPAEECGGLRRAPRAGRGRGAAAGSAPRALEGGGNRVRLPAPRTPRCGPAPRAPGLAGAGGTRPPPVSAPGARWVGLGAARGPAALGGPRERPGWGGFPPGPPGLRAGARGLGLPLPFPAAGRWDRRSQTLRRGRRRFQPQIARAVALQPIQLWPRAWRPGPPPRPSPSLSEFSMNRACASGVTLQDDSLVNCSPFVWDGSPPGTAGQGLTPSTRLPPSLPSGGLFSASRHQVYGPFRAPERLVGGPGALPSPRLCCLWPQESLEGGRMGHSANWHPHPSPACR